MNLPRHLCLSLRHNPHRGDYRTAEQWLEDYLLSAEAGGESRDEAIAPDDRAAILATGEIWELSWCERTPVGSCSVVAATLARVLELAGCTGLEVGEVSKDLHSMVCTERDLAIRERDAACRRADELEAELNQLRAVGQEQS